MNPESSGIPRREFVRAAIAIGGTNALAACAARERSEPAPSTATTGPAHPQGSDPETLPDRQHAWSDYLVRDAHSDTVLPRHQLLLFLDYAGDGTPTGEERTTVEEALRTVERAYQYGAGDDPGGSFARGLLSMLGYAPRYFDRFDEPLPRTADLPAPEALLDELGEDPAKADPHDALLVLTSDFGSIVLGAEEALFGNVDRVNGVEVTATLDGVFETVERRTGVVGRGRTAEQLDSDDVPENSPLAMGFRSNYADSIPPEDAVTITDGPFAGGTTLQSSRLSLDLDSWYEKDHGERVEEMFSPSHTPDQVGEIGEALGTHSGVTEEIVDSLAEHASERGRVGHSQKAAAARDDEFRPRILRRSEGVATDTDRQEFNFNSIQRGIDDFVRTREAMNAPDLDVDREHDGILAFFEVLRRGTYLVPPRAARALPTPNPDA